jgi:hypothetical protein
VALAGWWVVVVGWPAGGPLEGNVRQKKSPAVAGWWVVAGGLGKFQRVAVALDGGHSL